MVISTEGQALTHVPGVLGALHSGQSSWAR